MIISAVSIIIKFMTILLKIIGLINASYLVYLSSSIIKSCFGGGECSTVLSSVYSSIFGIPLAAFGVSVYLTLLLIDILRYKDTITAHHSNILHLVILIPAAAIGIVLMLVQFVQIKSFCPYCFLNSFILFALFLLSYRRFKSSYGWRIELAPAQWISLSLIFLIPLFYSYNRSNSYLQPTQIGIVAGEEITLSDLKKSEFNSDYVELKRKMYQLKKQFMNHKALEIESKKNQLTPKDYLKKMVSSKINVTEDEITAFYETNKHDIPSDTTFADVKPSIKRYLNRKKESEAMNDFVQTIADKYNVQMIIPSPDPIHVRKNKYASHTIGKKSAPIHVIEFADLQCGHCKTAFANFKDIIKTMDGQIYFEYRHYPLPNNRFSKIFAKASNCAGQQNQFFDYVELTFANQKKLSQIQPVDLAKRLNLNESAFNSCMASDVTTKALMLISTKEIESASIPHRLLLSMGNYLHRCQQHEI